MDASAALLALERSSLHFPKQTPSLLRELERAGGWKLILHGQLNLLHEATLGIDAATLGRYPRMRVARMLAMCKDDRLPQAERAWSEFRREQAKATRGARLPGWELELLAEVVSGYAGHAPTRERLDDLQRLVREIPEHEPAARGTCFNILLHAAVERGEFAQAGQLAERALREFRRAGSTFGALFIHVQRGLARFRSGYVQAAMQDFEAAHALGLTHFAPDSVLVMLPKALLGAVAYERGDFAAAAAALDAALPVLEHEEGWTEPLWLVFRAASALALQRGTPEAAFAVLARAQKPARRRGLARLDALLGLQELDLAHRLRQVEHAARIAARLRLRDLAMRQDHATPAWRETVLHARLLLAARERWDPGQLAAITDACRQSGMPHLLCRALLLQIGAAASAGGGIVRVRPLLNELLAYMSPTQIWHSVIDAPGSAEAWATVSRHVGRMLNAHQRGIVHALSAALRAGKKSIIVGSQVTLVSASELRVLHALSEGLRNKEIARLLGRSENTVKFHLKHLAGKLGVSRRRALLERARTLGLLD